MAEDFSFDERVAEIYNQQRAHPQDVSQKIGQSVVSTVGQDAHILEIGIGTGRIALPVVDAGGTVTGIDLAPDMIEQVFNQKQHGTNNLYLSRADMHTLPFRANTFDAVVVVHVLHLANDWQQVLNEIARVLKPEGLFIQGDDWMDPESVIGFLRNTLRRLAVKHNPSLMPPAAGISKETYLSQLGCMSTIEQTVAEWTFKMSPEDRLKQVEQRLDAESWILPDDLFDTIYNELREHAAKRWTDLNAPQTVTRRFNLRMMRGNWQNPYHRP